MSRPRERDPSSHSNPDECVVTHCAWDAVVDFTESKVSRTDRVSSFALWRLIFLFCDDTPEDGRPGRRR